MPGGSVDNVSTGNTTLLRSQPSGYASTPLRVSEQAGQSVIAADATWTGTIVSAGAIVVLGEVLGDEMSATEVVIAEGATVEATIKTARLTVAGSLRGAVICTLRLEILPSGVIDGDVSAPTVVVHEGATVSGSLRMTGETARDDNAE